MPVNSKNSQTSENNQRKIVKKRGRPAISDDLQEALDSIDFNFDFSKKTLSKRERLYKKNAAETLLMLGFTIYEVEKATNIHHATLARWKSQFTEEQKQKMTQTLLTDINENTAHFVNSTLSALSRIALFCSTPEYLCKHDPHQISELFDTVGNQTFKLIESNQRAQLAKLEVQSRQPRLQNYQPTQNTQKQESSAFESESLTKQGEPNDE